MVLATYIEGVQFGERSTHAMMFEIGNGRAGGISIDFASRKEIFVNEIHEVALRISRWAEHPHFSEELASVDMNGNVKVSEDLTAEDAVRLIYQVVRLFSTASTSHMSRPLPELAAPDSDGVWTTSEAFLAGVVSGLQAHGMVK